MDNENTYGKCVKCQGELRPEWFIEEEYKVDSLGRLTWTGKKRRNCSYLECIKCLKKHAVDNDTFSGEWY